MRHHRFAMLALAMFGSMQAHAEDIDLYTGGASAAAAANVVFALDTGAAFNASNSAMRCNIDPSKPLGQRVRTDGTGPADKFTSLDKTNGGVEQCAVYAMIEALNVATINLNIAVMVFNKNQNAYDIAREAPGSKCVGSNGGCLILPLTKVDANSKGKLLEWVRGWQSNNQDRSIEAPQDRGDGALMQEIWAYYRGKTGISGTDYSQPKYAKPDGCESNHVIWVGNNYAQQATPKDKTNSDGSPRTRLLRTGPAAQNADPRPSDQFTSTIEGAVKNSCTTLSGTFVQPLNTKEGDGAFMLNWAGYMNSQGIPTTAVAIQGPSCDNAYAAMMQEMASEEWGGGQFYKADGYQSILNALNTALGTILAKNTAFAAASLPVSVNAQGTFLNRVYIGMFRPSADFKPLWHGNLKQYKIGAAGSTLQLQDADGASAVSTGSAASGFIAGCARSFWTPTTADAYWSGNTGSTTCLTNAEIAKASNFPDGDIVEKGGQGYRLRASNPANRALKTCDPSSTSNPCSALIDFVGGTTTERTIPQLKLNPSGTDRNTLIDWLRGYNNTGELSLLETAMRSTAHGDVVHSRPAAVNHGAETSPNIVVYYGGNDGIFRAVNGNRACTTDPSGNCIPSSPEVIGGVAPGGEIWSFVAPEFWPKIKRLRDNAPAISYPGAPGTERIAKDYGFDGPASSFQGRVKGVNKTYVYATMRRGGRMVYAFDVSTPQSPSLLWRKGCPNQDNDEGCSAGFENLGQTWGSLKPLYAAGYEGGKSPLLIMAGGYDKCEDTLPNAPKNHACTTGSGPGTTKGNRVYLLDAVTGVVVDSFSTPRAVVGDPTLVTDDATGLAKYAYSVDMAGNVYRLSFGSEDKSWTFKRIASLGCDDPAACTDAVSNRKFMYGPSVVTPDGSTYYVLMGSGDREKPLAVYAEANKVVNHFFMIMDKPESSAWLQSERACSGTICKASLKAIDPESRDYPVTDIGDKMGWYLSMRAGEQVVTQALTLFSTTTFSTHTPETRTTGSNTCTSGLGKSRIYNLIYSNASSANGTDKPYQELLVSGLASSPVGGNIILDDGSREAFCIGCNAKSPYEAERKVPFNIVNRAKRRSYHYIAK